MQGGWCGVSTATRGRRSWALETGLVPGAASEPLAAAFVTASRPGIGVPVQQSDDRLRNPAALCIRPVHTLMGPRAPCTRVCFPIFPSFPPPPAPLPFSLQGGYTPLHLAAHKGCTRIVRALLAHPRVNPGRGTM